MLWKIFTEPRELLFYPFSIFRYQSDVGIKTLVEVVKAVFKGLLEVAGPAIFSQYNFNN